MPEVKETLRVSNDDVVLTMLLPEEREGGSVEGVEIVSTIRRECARAQWMDEQSPSSTIYLLLVLLY
jgi:hypothetical protein